MFSKVPQYALRAIEILQGHGFQAHLVGGCVRDILMGREPQDYDINTNAMPQQMQRAFEGYRQVETGIKHGTLSVWIENHQVEITTYRRDGKYSDGRHPDSVELGAELRDDLARRDFTINAMCWTPQGGLVDMFGGQEDLINRTIRCVGDPEERFREDALRILRALRFASVLDAQIEPHTDAAVRSMAELLNRVSAERCAVELTKLLCGSAAGRVVQAYPAVLDTILPGLGQMRGYNQDNPHHCYTLLEHTARVVDAVPPQPVERLAALLHDMGKPACRTVDQAGIAHYRGHVDVSAEMARQILEGLRFDGATVEAVVQLVKHHDVNVDNISEAGIRRMMGRLGVETFDMLISLKKADNLAQNRELSDRIPNLERICSIEQQILEKQSPYKLSQLEINGDDLIDIGYKPGPAVGNVLRELLDMVVEARISNSREALLAAAKELMKDN